MSSAPVIDFIAAFTAECNAADELMRMLGLSPERCRTDGGAINLARVRTFLAEQHPDDLAVNRLAVAMKAKLAQARAKGRGGWDRPDECSIDGLATGLIQHVWKGDPIDVANFAMFLYCRQADPALIRNAVVEFAMRAATAAVELQGLMQAADQQQQQQGEPSK